MPEVHQFNRELKFDQTSGKVDDIEFIEPDKERQTERIGLGQIIWYQIVNIGRATFTIHHNPVVYISAVNHLSDLLNHLKYNNKRYLLAFNKLNKEFLQKEKFLSPKEKQEGKQVNLQLSFSQKHFTLLMRLLYEKGMLGETYEAYG